MKPLTASPSLHGPHLLVVADDAVDMDLLRKLRFTQVTIARRRPNGEFDHRIDLTFNFAIAVIANLDAESAQAVVKFAMPRLTNDAPLQFLRSATTRTADLQLLREALSDVTVDVAAMPDPFNRQAIEVRPQTLPPASSTSRWAWWSRYRRQGSRRPADALPL